MFKLALHNLLGRPARTTLSIVAVGIAISVLTGLSSIAELYTQTLHVELNRMGLHLMVVPMGCPYESAATVLKGGSLETTMPLEVVDLVKKDPATEVASPLLTVTVPRPDEQRVDTWVGITEDALKLRPWWGVISGQKWFTRTNGVILGAETALIETREPGDKLLEPVSKSSLLVEGVLKRSGTADDNQFFVSLQTAQQLLGQPGRITAVAVRLKDPYLLLEAQKRFQEIPGAQVVTMTEIMGAFLNMLGGVKLLVNAITSIALVIGGLSLFNTLLASVIDRLNEFATLRAIGAGPSHIYALIASEAIIQAMLGFVLGVVAASLLGQYAVEAIRQQMPLLPSQSFTGLTRSSLLQGFFSAGFIGLLSAIYPAWHGCKIAPAQALKAEL